MRDGSSLVATRYVDLPPHWQAPSVNPPGTCVPSASIRSKMAAAAETQVYPFSQRKQVVTDGNTPGDQEPSAMLATGARASGAHLSENDQNIVCGRSDVGSSIHR